MDAHDPPEVTGVDSVVGAAVDSLVLGADSVLVGADSLGVAAEDDSCVGVACWLDAAAEDSLGVVVADSPLGVDACSDSVEEA